jgi:hypothetical protein
MSDGAGIEYSLAVRVHMLPELVKVNTVEWMIHYNFNESGGFLLNLHVKISASMQIRAFGMWLRVWLMHKAKTRLECCKPIEHFIRLSTFCHHPCSILKVIE